MRMAQMKYSNPDESDCLGTIDEISKRTCIRLVAINNSQNNNNLQQLYDSYRLLGLSIFFENCLIIFYFNLLCYIFSCNAERFKRFANT